MYYKFTNNTSCLREYHIKPHLIFTLYNDAKLLEAKTLKQSKEFESSLGDKIKTNVLANYDNIIVKDEQIKTRTEVILKEQIK